jgi:glycosyltransferase involved in cell wall biosynthesis
MKKTISFIVTVYNEEVNIEQTFISIFKIIDYFKIESEIIVVDDGSKDRSLEIAKSIKEKESKYIIKIIEHKSNMGLGTAYFTGVDNSVNDYIIWVPGDNECGFDNMLPLIQKLGKVDIIIPYVINPEIRPFHRRILSKLFVLILNNLSGLNLYYYNGTVVHSRLLLQGCPIRSSGFEYQANILIYLITKGATYQQIPVQLSINKPRQSSAFKIKNIYRVSRALIKIILFRISKNYNFLKG